MLKIKILKILPFWLLSLVLVCAIQLGASLFPYTSAETISKPVNSTETPEVLGASTVIRGELASPIAAEVIENSNQASEDVKKINAKSYLVFDLSTGQELLKKDTDKKLFIASLTKLMTGLVAYQNIDLNQSIAITPNDVLKVSPFLNLLPGDSVNALDIFNSMLVGSCNDAALALADHTSKLTGINFADLMNSQAKALGMDSSHFSNPMGFDSDRNYSTANDLKKLIISTQQLAIFRNLGRRAEYSFNAASGQSYSTTATNGLIKTNPDLQAIKTGYTGEALGAMATKLEVNGREIVILVLNSKDRELDTLKLKQIILTDFNWN